MKAFSFYHGTIVFLLSETKHRIKKSSFLSRVMVLIKSYSLKQYLDFPFLHKKKLMTKKLWKPGN